jgi:hypothetical protein
MRFLLQLLGLLVIVCIGWNQPFCDVARTLLPWAQIPPSRLSVIKARAAAAAAQPPPPSSGLKFTPQYNNPLNASPYRH